MDLFHNFLNQWGETLLTVSLQAAVLFVVIGIISLLSKKASPSFKYWLWCILLLRLCIPIEINVPIGMGGYIEDTVVSIPDRFIDEGKDIQQLKNTISFSSSNLPGNEVIPEIQAVSEEKAFTMPELSLVETISLAWFLSVLLLSILLIWRIVSVHYSLRNSSAIKKSELVELLETLRARLGVKREVKLLYLNNNKLNGPLAAGFLKPAIYLPQQIVETWDVKDIEPFLLHELAHIKRYDILVNWVQIFVQMIFFFHPLVWYANRIIWRLREDICDDTAIAYTSGGRTWYTEKMIHAVKECYTDSAMYIVVLAFIETKSSLGKRIVRILNNNYKNHPRLTSFSIITLIAITVFSILLAGGRSDDEEVVSLESAEESSRIEDIYTKETDLKITINDDADRSEITAAGKKEEKEAYKLLPNSELKNNLEKYKRATDFSESIKIHKSVEALFQPAGKSYEEIHSMVKARGKTGLTYFYSDDAVSTSVQSVVFNDRVFLKNFNSYFAGFKVKGKDKHGDELFKKFNITNVPTFALFEASGELINKVPAFGSPFNEFEKENWDRLFDTQNPGNSLIKLRKRIAEEPNNYDVRMRYAKNLEIAKEYKDKRNEKLLYKLSSQTLAFIYFKAEYNERENRIFERLTKGAQNEFIYDFSIGVGVPARGNKLSVGIGVNKRAIE